ncbi:hypothetical protein GCM10009850_048730 [Nonomuraea monospora]|uniref:Uncharacterized protein n=1 Tax=Nonomuraea monospora TaxID=568818 RepID=A0ABN3CJA8_9ACTN
MRPCVLRPRAPLRPAPTYALRLASTCAPAPCAHVRPCTMRAQCAEWRVRRARCAVALAVRAWCVLRLTPGAVAGRARGGLRNVWGVGPKFAYKGVDLVLCDRDLTRKLRACFMSPIP